MLSHKEMVENGLFFAEKPMDVLLFLSALVSMGHSLETLSRDQQMRTNLIKVASPRFLANEDMMLAPSLQNAFLNSVGMSHLHPRVPLMEQDYEEARAELNSSLGHFKNPPRLRHQLPNVREALLMVFNFGTSHSLTQRDLFPVHQFERGNELMMDALPSALMLNCAAQDLHWWPGFMSDPILQELKDFAEKQLQHIPDVPIGNNPESERGRAVILGQAYAACLLEFLSKPYPLKSRMEANSVKSH